MIFFTPFYMSNLLNFILVINSNRYPKFLGIGSEVSRKIIRVLEKHSVMFGEFFDRQGIYFMSVINAADGGIELVVNSHQFDSE